MGTHQLAPGVVLGRYELLLPIASGGMATVWVARSKGSRGFSKTVAIKTILPNLSDDPTFEQMFLDEASIASKIQHPNVAQILDLGEEDEILYLAMEWVDGESLSTLTKFAKKDGNEIPLRIGLKIVSQACAGIHAAHELKDDDDRLLMLVHRDVSPQNILISSSGIVKIVDFGVAKALGRTGETTAGQLKGKVPFMSPEQAKGGAVDRRTDIFALGIILYRIATGAHPFLDENDIKTMRNIIARPPMPPRVKNPAVPVELERVILKALQKDPAKRFATAHELEQEIEAVLAQTGASVTLDEVGTFVRATIGERDRKRRAAIRDAALKIDETNASTDPRSAPPPRESVSEVMLTKTQTPPNALDDGEVTRSITPSSLRGPALPGKDKSDHEVTASVGAPVIRPPQKSEPPVASSPTLAALAAPPERAIATAPSKRTKVAAIALASVAGIVAGTVLVAKLGGAPDPSSRVSTAPAGAAPSAAVAPTQRPVAESPAPSTSAAELDIASLPDSSAEASAAPKTTAARPPRAGSPPASDAASKPTGTAAAPDKPATTAAPTAAAPTATAKPTSNGLPTIQDPGF